MATDVRAAMVELADRAEAAQASTRRRLDGLRTQLMQRARFQEELRDLGAQAIDELNRSAEPEPQGEPEEHPKVVDPSVLGRW